MGAMIMSRAGNGISSSSSIVYWRVRYTLDRAWCFFVRVPIGKLRKPKKIDFHAEPYPVCPRCGEIPYRVDYCVFCGQRFRT